MRFAIMYPQQLQNLDLSVLVLVTFVVIAAEIQKEKKSCMKPQKQEIWQKLNNFCRTHSWILLQIDTILIGHLYWFQHLWFQLGRGTRMLSNCRWTMGPISTTKFQEEPQP